MTPDLTRERQAFALTWKLDKVAREWVLFAWSSPGAYDRWRAKVLKIVADCDMLQHRDVDPPPDLVD